jgi:hypothetical protein
VSGARHEELSCAFVRRVRYVLGAVSGLVAIGLVAAGLA